MEGSKRWITGALLAIALLTFFFPLATIQIPIVGNQDFSGYDLISKARNFQQIAEQSRELRGGSLPAASAPDSNEAEPLGTGMPLSVQALPFLPFLILASFALAGVALFGSMTDIGSSGFVKGTTTTGAALAILSAVHIAVVNSDLHTYFRDQINANSPGAGDNPFAAMAQLAASAIQLRPGVGLYVLAGLLALTTIVLNVLPQTSPELADDGDTFPRHRGFLNLEREAMTTHASANSFLGQSAPSDCQRCGHFLRSTDRFCPGCGVVVHS